MRHLVDATGEHHAVGQRRDRIVSLVPSTTETVFSLDAGDKLVGVTRYCVRPEEARRLPLVGGTKSPRLQDIEALEPDFVLANFEENRREDIEALRRHVPVYVSYPRDLDTAIADIRAVGELLDHADAAEALACEIQASRSKLTRCRPFRYLYLIWHRPYMAVGSGTFIDALLSEAGGVNVAPQQGRYPELSITGMEHARPDVVLLSSEPFPFSKEHADELKRLLPDTKILLADGELLSWHGARLRYGLPYLQELVISI